MILEFMGLPGIGKSTIAEQLIVSLRGRGVECLSRSDVDAGYVKMQAWLRATLSIPVTARDFATMVDAILCARNSANQIENQFRQALKYLGRFKYLQEVMRRNATSHLILDQGLIQQAVSLASPGCPFCGCRVISMLSRSLTDRSHVIINVDGEVSLAVSRINTRGKNTCIYRKIPREAQNAYLTACKDNIAWVFNWVKSNTRATCVQIDSDLPVEYNVERILNEVIDYASPH